MGKHEIKRGISHRSSDAGECLFFAFGERNLLMMNEIVVMTDERCAN